MAFDASGKGSDPFSRGVLLATLAIQFALQSWFFPLKELFTATPLYYIDSAFHQYQMETARLLCAGHRLLGYDPYFAAGYLGGVTFNASAKLPALASCLIGSSQSVVPMYKLFSFTMGVLAPAALVLAARWLRFDVRATWIAALFGLLSWWTGPLRWYHTAGLVSYVAVTYAAVPFAAGASLACREPTAFRVFGVAAAAALLTLIHPLFVVIAIVLCGAVLLGDLPAHGGMRRIVAPVIVAAVTVFAVNGAWLVASLGAPNFATVEQPYQRLVDPLLVLREPLGIAATAAGGSRLYVGLLVGAFAALRLAGASRRRSWMTWIGAAALLMLWASLGGLHKGIASLQPNRFSALAWLVLSLPAAWGTAALWNAWRQRTGNFRIVAGAGLLSVALVTGFFVREAALEIFSERAARYAVARPEVKGEGPLSPRLVDWIRTNTDASSRVFFETSLARIHDHAHMAGVYALQTQREFIGGPYPYMDFVSAWDGVAFGRPLETIATADLVRYLDLYNVKWMLCHSAPCRRAMEALPETSSVATIGPLVAYRRQVTPGFFIAGSGNVRGRCINRVDIEVDGAGAGEVVLKYHWVPGLVSTPPMTLEKRFILDDPRPFIAIAHPAPRFSLGVGEPARTCPGTSSPPLP
jgi:hypothetical protein